jgi:hypothetical protein
LYEEQISTIIEESSANNLVANFFKTATFKNSTEDLRLESDMVSDAKSFYDALYSATKTSHTLSEHVLPDYTNLQQGLSIKKMMIPAGKSYNNGKAKHFVEVVSQAIYHFTKGPESKNVINGRFFPQTRMATDMCNEVCGLAILDSILSWTIPKLGANVDF